MATKKAASSAWDEAALKQHLKTEPLRPVYFLYGEEGYLVRRYTRQIVTAALGDDDMRAFNLTKLDGLVCQGNEIIGAAETLPMMAERRCVVVRNWNVEKAYRDVQTFKKDFLSFFENLPETTVLVFQLLGKLSDFLPKDDKYKTTSPKWTAFCEAVASAGVVAELSARPIGENARALSALAARRQVTMETSTARLLIERVGNDLTRLINETEKLCAAAKDNVITPQLVQELTFESLEARIYDLSKAIVGGQADRIYKIFKAFAFHREDPVSVLSVLSGAFVDYYRVRVALDSAQSLPTVVSTFHYERRAFVVDQAATAVAHRSTASLRRCLDLLAEADARLKSTSVDPWQLLELLSVRLMEEMQRS